MLIGRRGLSAELDPAFLDRGVTPPVYGVHPVMISWRTKKILERAASDEERPCGEIWRLKIELGCLKKVRPLSGEVNKNLSELLVTDLCDLHKHMDCHHHI